MALILGVVRVWTVSGTERLSSLLPFLFVADQHPSPGRPQCSRLSVHFVTLSKLRCQQWDVAVNSAVDSIQISLVFPLMCFFVLVSPSPLVCDSFLSLSLLFVTFRVLRSSSQILCKISFSLSDLSLMIRLALWVWGRIYRGRRPLHLTVELGVCMCCHHDLTTDCVNNLDYMAKVAFQVSVL